jgi:hypothetical protein
MPAMVSDDAIGDHDGAAAKDVPDGPGYSPH